MMPTSELTTDSVIALPTPTAPPLNCKPLKTAMTVMIQAKKKLLIIPLMISLKKRDPVICCMKAVGEISKAVIPIKIPPAIPTVSAKIVSNGKVTIMAQSLGTETNRIGSIAIVFRA